MKITRTSPLTGRTHTREIDVTQAQILHWMAGALIQTVMPELSKADREFIMTGATADEWDATFGESE